METLDAESLALEFRSRVDALPSPKVPRVRPIRRKFSRKISSAQSEQVLQFAERLIGLDLRIWAYEIVHYHRPTLRTLDAATIESLGRGLADWASVDVFGGYLAGPAWVNRQIGDPDVHRWARSPDRWWRRTALVATVGLNTKTRGGYGDTPRTLAVCQILADDRDDMVVKALSWALRTLANHDPPAVQHFLTTNHHRLAARVIRETHNKLTTGIKNPRKKPG
ncbi:MAG: DNA alkylation repair protein [Chloroflexi bacterium]|nr:DNA alkylation repair protein [Chloroflexota bacterium]